MPMQRMIPLLVFIFSSFMLWNAWQQEHLPKQNTVQTQSNPVGVNQASSTPTLPSTEKTISASAISNSELTNLKQGERVKVTTDVFQAEFDTVGGDLKRLKLLKQLTTGQDAGKPLDLFNDVGDIPYVVQTGLIGGNLPNHTSSYIPSVTSATLEPNQNSVSLSFKATVPNKVEVIKTYTFTRGSYLITLNTTIHNLGNQPLKTDSYYQFLRGSKAPPGDPRFVSTYTGPAFYTEASKFEKLSFKDIDKGAHDIPGQANNGWVAMIQHYFVSAWLPSQGTQREFYARKVGDDLYTAGLIIPVNEIAPGGTSSVNVPLYAGPQEGEKLKALAPGLQLTIDFGRLTIIATPIFYVLNLIHSWVNNWGVAIILLTVLIKLIFFPLSAASYKSMAKMRTLQPKMTRLKEQFGEDKARLNQAMMELYRTEKINPLGGCLPMVVQIPVFISLYWVLLEAVELRNAPFIGWIHDLSAKDPFYILPLIMTASMFIQQRMSPKPPDPVQAKVMMFMPLMFSFMFFFFPAGLVLYWVVNNILSIAQQWQITKMMGDGNKK
ncbi:MAG: membrane protein insertase YidC [Betaproteobacteria bacterium]|nr:membrane protein insertase YidC [Betaproteobacteria bacterium]